MDLCEANFVKQPKLFEFLTNQSRQKIMHNETRRSYQPLWGTPSQLSGYQTPKLLLEPPVYTKQVYVGEWKSDLWLGEAKLKVNKLLLILLQPLFNLHP